MGIYIRTGTYYTITKSEHQQRTSFST